MLGRAIRAISAAILATIAIPASAQEFPTRPIQVVVPFAPGGGVDFFARAFVNSISEEMDQPVVIEYREGAAGAIGTAYVAKAKPDGYTLLLGSSTVLSLTPHLRSDLSYSPDDLVPVSLVASSPLTVVVTPSLPVNDLKGLVEYAKAHPGELAYGVAGVGSTNHLAVRMLEHLADVKLLAVPYKGSGPALTDLRAGAVQFMFTGAQDVLEPHRSGALRIISMLAKDRVSVLPDVPTAAEEGYPALQAPVWYGLLAPAGTPQSVIDKLNEASLKALRHPVLRERFDSIGAVIQETSPADFGEILKDASETWGSIVKTLDIKAQ